MTEQRVIETSTIELLMKKSIEWFEETKKSNLRREMDLKKKIKEATEKEIGLLTRLKKDREIVSKMESEYLELEARIETEKRAEIEKDTLTKEDVKKGKVSLLDYFNKGKRPEQITDQTLEESQKELETTLKLVRTKNLEILEMEKELFEVQLRIRGMAAQPGREFQRSLEQLTEHLQIELGLIIEDLPAARYLLDNVKHKLTVCNGKSIGMGYSWTARTLKEAQALIFNPMIPKSLILNLKKQLSDYDEMEEDEKISIQMKLPQPPGYEGEITISGQMSGVIRTRGKTGTIGRFTK